VRFRNNKLRCAVAISLLNVGLFGAHCPYFAEQRGTRIRVSADHAILPTQFVNPSSPECHEPCREIMQNDVGSPGPDGDRGRGDAWLCRNELVHDLVFAARSLSHRPTTAVASPEQCAWCAASRPSAANATNGLVIEQFCGSQGSYPRHAFQKARFKKRLLRQDSAR
jgi:hypothetical protein